MSDSIDDKIISDFLRSLGPWRKHIVIGGGFAPIIYRLYLADTSAKAPAATRDLDSLIPRRVTRESHKSILDHLKEAGFKEVLRGADQPPVTTYEKLIEGVEVEVEFLTDRRAKNADPNIVIEGVSAQTLSYLELSLEQSVGFTTKEGEVGKVVEPAAWIFHKGLTFPRRAAELKKLKDLYGIWYVGTQLSRVSEQALENVRGFTSSRRAWFETFKKNLRGWSRNASPEDWKQLEAQDPGGDLKKAAWLWVMEQLFEDP